MKRSCTVLLCVLIGNPFYMYGWSAEGHQTVAIIAMQRLQGTNTGTRIAALLGPMTLEDIATCPDEVRALEEYHTQMSPNCKTIFPNPPKGTAPWHFVDTPIKGASFEPAPADVTQACGQNCVLVQIDKYLSVLSASKPTDGAAKKLQEKQALSFVVHFIGDVHQPLHASDRNGDHGGNAEHIEFLGTDEGHKLVLHGIWDNQIVKNVEPTPNQLAASLAPEISQASAENNGKPMDWAIQSYNYARDVAYKGVPPANGNQDVADLEQPYQNAAAPVVRIQIARAGVRLATALQQAMP